MLSDARLAALDRPFRGAAVVMGVCGSGKTIIGEALAARLDGVFVEGDQIHPAGNVAKMSSGIALTDQDRLPWLDAIGAAMRTELSRDRGVIAACSALKRAYRDRLRSAAGKPVAFIFLHGAREVLAERMRVRRGHFMPASLLDSQLATLEPPGPGERAIELDAAQPVAVIVEAAARFLVEIDSSENFSPTQSIHEIGPA